MAATAAAAVIFGGFIVIFVDFRVFSGVGKSMIWRVWAGNGALGPENLDSPPKAVQDPTLKSQIGLIKVIR